MSETQSAYNLASLAMADVIGAHELDLREWLILDFIRRQSFGGQRNEAYIPRLELFAKATSISVGNCSAILKRLKGSLVIEERPQWYYGFMFPVGNWKRPVRLDQVEVIKQLALFEAPEHLRDAMRENFVEQCRQGNPGWEPGLSTARGLAPETRAHPGVPESGTPSLSQTRTRIGNEPQTPITTGVPSALPESGSSLAILGLEQCSNASSKKQLNIVTMNNDVPESGRTCGEASGSRPAVFSPDQRELMSELRQAGAFGAHRRDPSRPFWFGMVRDRPSIVTELLGELRYAREQNRSVQHPGKFMNYLWQKWGRPDT